MKRYGEKTHAEEKAKYEAIYQIVHTKPQKTTKLPSTMTTLILNLLHSASLETHSLLNNKDCKKSKPIILGSWIYVHLITFAITEHYLET